MPLSPRGLGSRANLPALQSDSALLTGGLPSTRFTIAFGPAVDAFIVPAGVTSIDALLIGGGAPGFFSDFALIAPGGGGGAGGVLISLGIAVNPGDNLTLTAGGSTPANTLVNGVDSHIFNNTTATELARAGGGGVTANNGNVNNGSGGGGFVIFGFIGVVPPGLGDGAGFAGGIAATDGATFGNGGGGGGAGAVGQNAGAGGGNGGVGIVIPAGWSILSGITVAGGGGGGASPGPAGLNGTGHGNFTGGGGNSGTNLASAGDGDSGIIILRY